MLLQSCSGSPKLRLSQAVHFAFQLLLEACTTLPPALNLPHLPLGRGDRQVSHVAMASESGYSDKNVDMCANYKKKLLGVGQATLRGEPRGPATLQQASVCSGGRTDSRYRPRKKQDLQNLRWVLLTSHTIYRRAVLGSPINVWHPFLPDLTSSLES